MRSCLVSSWQRDKMLCGRLTSCPLYIPSWSSLSPLNHLQVGWGEPANWACSWARWLSRVCTETGDCVKRGCSTESLNFTRLKEENRHDFGSSSKLFSSTTTSNILPWKQVDFLIRWVISERNLEKVKKKNKKKNLLTQWTGWRWVQSACWSGQRHSQRSAYISPRQTAQDPEREGWTRRLRCASAICFVKKSSEFRLTAYLLEVLLSVSLPLSQTITGSPTTRALSSANSKVSIFFHFLKKSYLRQFQGWFARRA